MWNRDSNLCPSSLNWLSHKLAQQFIIVLSVPKIILADESNSIKAHTLWIPYKSWFQGYKRFIRSITAFDIVKSQLKFF